METQHKWSWARVAGLAQRQAGHAHPGALQSTQITRPPHRSVLSQTPTHTHTALIVYRYAWSGFHCVHSPHRACLLIQQHSGLQGYLSIETLTDVRILSAAVVMKGDPDVHQQVSDKEDVENAMQKRTFSFYRVSFYVVNQTKCRYITFD